MFGGFRGFVTITFSDRGISITGNRSNVVDTFFVKFCGKGISKFSRNASDLETKKGDYSNPEK